MKQGVLFKLNIMPVHGTLEAGSGSSLPAPILVSAGLATAVATVASTLSICAHLKNYRKPALQR